MSLKFRVTGYRPDRDVVEIRADDTDTSVFGWISRSAIWADLALKGHRPGNDEMVDLVAKRLGSIAKMTEAEYKAGRHKPYIGNDASDATLVVFRSGDLAGLR
jgi:hypothetical protein